MSAFATFAPAPPTGAALPRVLVVDDDARNRRLLEALLAPEGYEIAHAASGEEALARISGDPELALVLLDLAMPGLGGIETCRRVRRELGLVDLPIVFVTAHGERSERILAKTSAPTTSCSSPWTRSSSSPG